MTTTFDAAKFVRDFEGLGASLSAKWIGNTKYKVFRTIKPDANRTMIEDIWNNQIEPYPDRRAAVAKLLVEKEEKR